MLTKYFHRINRSFDKDFVQLSFDFKFKTIPEKIDKNDAFIFENELFLVTFGEREKFTSDYIYQSKLVVFKDENMINFGGYAPDWRRNADLLKDKRGNKKFLSYAKYHVEITLSKYRVYIDINNGELVDSYGNGRLEIDNIDFYVNDGVEIELENVDVKEYDKSFEICSKTLAELLEGNCFCNFLNYHIDQYGLNFDRLNIIQNIKARTRNSGHYDSNVMLDVLTDSKFIKIKYFVLDSEVENYEFKFGVLVDNKTTNFGSYRKVSRNDYLEDEFEIANDNSEYRLTVVFPTGFSVAIKEIEFSEGATFKAVEKNKTILFLGDSITEGSECFDPENAYVNQITRYFNTFGYNFAVSGTTYNEFDLLGNYSINPDYVIIANGTNSFCMGTAEKDSTLNEMESLARKTLSNIKNYFPNAKIIGLLPLWRNDENGPKFSLKETSERIKSIYESFDEEIVVVDCYNFIPHETKYFSNAQLALHPNSSGHDLYAKNLIEVLKNHIKEI